MTITEIENLSLVPDQFKATDSSWCDVNNYPLQLLDAVSAYQWKHMDAIKHFGYEYLEVDSLNIPGWKHKVVHEVIDAVSLEHAQALLKAYMPDVQVISVEEMTDQQYDQF